MSLFQGVPETVPSQKCHMNVGPILDGYGDVGHLKCSMCQSS